MHLTSRFLSFYKSGFTCLLLTILIVILFSCTEEPDAIGEIKIQLPGRTVQPPEDLIIKVNVVDQDGVQSVHLVFKRPGYHISTAAIDKTIDAGGVTVFNIEEILPLPIEFRSELYALTATVLDNKGNQYVDEDEIWVKELIEITINSPKINSTIDTPYELLVDCVVVSNAPLKNSRIDLLMGGTSLTAKNYPAPELPETFVTSIKEKIPFSVSLTEDTQAKFRIIGEVYLYTWSKEVPVIIRK